MLRNTGLLLVSALLLLAGCAPAVLDSEADFEPAPASGEQVVEAVEEGAGSAPAANAGPVAADVIGGDEASLREFIRHYVGGSPFAQAVTVRIGELPSNLPIEAPLPPEAVVVGSVTTDQGAEQTYWNILLSSPQSADELEAFYAGAFSGEAWGQPGGYQSSGFVANEPRTMAFCHLESGLLVNLSLSEMAEGGAGINLSIMDIPQAPACGEQQQPYHDEASGLLPALTAPPGIRQQNSGGGSGGSSGPGGIVSAYRTATLSGNLSAAEIGDHYNGQLQGNGWTLASSGGEGDAAWSTWTFLDDEGKEWIGNLFILRTAAGNDFFAWISVERRLSED